MFVTIKIGSSAGFFLTLMRSAGFRAFLFAGLEESRVVVIGEAVNKPAIGKALSGRVS
jgi:hypothetical protein